MKLIPTIYLLFFLFISATAFSQPPVASLPFSGNTNDVSGNNNNGYLGGVTNNPILVPDRFGNPNSAYQLGGFYNQNWITIPNSSSLQFTSQMTLSIWFKQCSFGGMDGYGNYSPNGYNVIWSKAGDGIGADPGMWCYSFTNASKNLGLTFDNTNGNPTYGMNFQGDITYQCFDSCQWLNVIYMIDATSWKMYVNKRLVKSIPLTSPADFSSANNEDLYFGRMWGGGLIWYPFNGVIDDINIYNYAINQHTIDSLYGNYNDPLALNNTITINSLTIKDVSCNSHNITVNATGYSGTLEYSINGGTTWLTSNTFNGLTNGNYTLSIRNSCAQIDTTLKLQSTRFATITQAICQGQSFKGHTASGTYLDTVKTALGCDSITTLQLTVKAKSAATINQTICQGQSYLGHTLSGTYKDTIVNSNGCDSLRTLNLIVKPIATSSINQSICQGQSYLGHTVTGSYKDTIVNSNGCDSVITLNLTVKPTSTSTINQTICQGQSFLGHTVSGTYKDTLTTVSGCDSIRTLVLAVNSKLFSTISKTICPGQSFLGHSVAGTYKDTFTAANGCDSIRTLVLTVYTDIHSNLTKNICQGQSFLGHTTTGTYIDTFVSANGCRDSIRTLNLIVNNPYYSGQTASICTGQTYQGHSTSGTYIDSFISVSGCDSIIVLTLIVGNKTYYSYSATICQNQSYMGHTVSGDYNDTIPNKNGCDSIITLHLAVTPISKTKIDTTICIGTSFAGYNKAGTYIDTFKSASGCDSIRTINLSFFAALRPILPADTSICSGDSIILYPGKFNQYNWSTGATTSSIVVNASGKYAVTVFNKANCTATDSFKVIAMNPNPTNFLPNDITVCSGEKYTLTGYWKYLWNTGDTLASATLINTNPVTLNVVDYNGCKGQDTMQVVYLNCDNIQIPNVFSPNGDGKHEVFIPNVVPYNKAYKLEVFDRNGQIVFTSYDATVGWDGKYHGVPVPMGEYYYILKCTLQDDRVLQRAGGLLVIR